MNDIHLPGLVEDLESVLSMSDVVFSNNGMWSMLRQSIALILQKGDDCKHEDLKAPSTLKFLDLET